MVLYMKCGLLARFWGSFIIGWIVLVAAAIPAAGEPSTAAVAAFNSYAAGVEARLADQHRSATGFLAGTASGANGESRLRNGELIVERVETPAFDEPGAMLHHWRGTAFAPGAKAADFERLLKDFDGYTRVYSPQVVRAQVVAREGERLQATMRMEQRHVITVVMDSSYDVTFGRLDWRHGYSLSRSTRITEIDGAGTAKERALTLAEEHGFLWRMNTYWTYEERDGGLYIQIEAVSLTRSIPRGLGWAVGPFVESAPRESLEFTLRSTCNGLRK